MKKYMYTLLFPIGYRSVTCRVEVGIIRQMVAIMRH